MGNSVGIKPVNLVDTKSEYVESPINNENEAAIKKQTAFEETNEVLRNSNLTGEELVPSESSYEEISDKNKKIILEENSKLKDGIEHIKSSIKLCYSNLENDILKHNMSLSVRKSLEDIYNYYFEFTDQVHRRIIGDQLAEEEAAELINSYMNILSNEGGEYPMEGYKYECVQILRGLSWNFSDASVKLGEDFGRTGFLSSMYNDLKKFQNTYKANEKQSFIVLSAMSIIYNCSKSSLNKKYFKVMEDIVDTVLWYSKHSKDHKHTNVLAPLSTIALAYLVDESQNHLISADGTIITTIIRMLEGALDDPKHMLDGFTATELVEGLTKLASHPYNSSVIMETGIMASLKRMLNLEQDKEQIVAAKCVWVLSFSDKNSDEINNLHQEVKEILINHKNNSSNKNLKNVATGALWLLEKNSNQNSKKSKKKKTKDSKLNKSVSLPAPGRQLLDRRTGQEETNQTEEDEFEEQEEKLVGEGKHIMISYQWHYQQTMLKIKSYLESYNYHIWMDISEMGGSTLERMADAVENSVVVLLALSQRYKDSVSCRTEAEYAYKCNKDVVPLLLERDYKPDGWLGAIVGTKLHFEFTVLSAFDNSLQCLKKELGNRGRKQKVSCTKREMFSPIKQMKTEVKDWTDEEARLWAANYKFSLPKTMHIDGSNLIFLQKLRLEAPEYFYRYLNENLKIRQLKDLQEFTEALTELK